MKWCSECNAVYEETLNVCPTCGTRLEKYDEEDSIKIRLENKEDANMRIQSRSIDKKDAYVFEQREGRDIIINGAVAEYNTQQYYQSRLTKLFQAIFMGEPYQLSHTSFTTIFRVEEHVAVGYPECARDIVLYGNIQNLFAVGDDVTVIARDRRGQLVARNIYSHSVDSNIRTQTYIPAGVIRMLTLLIALLGIFIVYNIANVDYAAMGAHAIDLIAVVAFKIIDVLLPIAVLVWIVWMFIKGIFK